MEIIQYRRPKLQLDKYLSVTVDLSSATWNTVATHELFTVTGLVAVQIIPECTENLAGGGTIEFGTETNTGSFISAKTITDIDAGHIIQAGVGSPDTSFRISNLADYIVNTVDIGYEIKAAAATDGTLIVHCWWESLFGGSITAGAGGTL